MEVTKLGRTVRAVEAIGDHLDEFLEIERLEDRVADGIRRDFFHSALPRRRKHDDVRPYVWIFIQDLLDEFVAVDLRHHQVEENEVEGAVAAKFFQPYLPIFGELDIEAHSPQNR